MPTTELLRETCGFCGRSVRSHIKRRECRYYWKYCNERCAAEDSHWEENPHTDGKCDACRFPIRDHYSHAIPLAMTRHPADIHFPEFVVLLPTTWLGCPTGSEAWF